jgi:hypothetical protein
MRRWKQTDLTEQVDYTAQRCEQFQNLIRVPSQPAHATAMTYHTNIEFSVDHSTQHTVSRDKKERPLSYLLYLSYKEQYQQVSHSSSTTLFAKVSNLVSNKKLFYFPTD